jgi:hypothetical protein
MLRGVRWVLLFFTSASIHLALAQVPPPADPPIKIGSVVFSGLLRTRVEIWDWFPGDANNQYAYSGSTLRFGLSGSKDTFEWRLEFEAPVILGAPDDAIAPLPQGSYGYGANYYTANDFSRNAASLFPKQAYVRWHPGNLNIRVGRFEFSDGTEVNPKDALLAGLKRNRINQRLIGINNFNYVGRSFDALQLGYRRSSITYAFFAGIPTRGVYLVDGWGELKVGIVYASATGAVAGKNNNGEWRAFAIYYNDWRRGVVKADNRPLALRARDFDNIRIYTYGGHYIHTLKTSSGAFDFLLWGALQTGEWGKLSHSGTAGSAEAGWQPPVLPKLKPCIRGGYSYTSGDNDALDSRHETFFRLLPTIRTYARFPFYNLMNNKDGYVLLSVQPHPAIVLKSQFHHVDLSSGNDLWYQGGGAYQPWSFGYNGRPGNGLNGFANVYDVGEDWAVNRHFNLNAYWGIARGGEVISKIYPKGANGKFGYVELLYQF